MKPLDNNVLMIVLKTGEKLTFSLPSGGEPEDFIKTAMELEGLSAPDVDRAYFINDPSYSPVTFQESFDLEKGLINELGEIKKRKKDTIRKLRNLILNKLDIQFLISLESECPDCTQHIKKIKEYLRDIPQLFDSEKFEYEETNKVLNFNVFDNVFDIDVSNPGSGYDNPPTVTIAPPQKDEVPGFQMKAIAEIEDGKVINIKTVRVGSSYMEAPIVSLSPPEEADGMQARAVASEPENNIYHYLEQGFENTYNIYDLYLKNLTTENKE